jgi:Glycosyl transferases group 1
MIKPTQVDDNCALSLNMNTLDNKAQKFETPRGNEDTRQIRVCMPSMRSFARNAFRCGMYEAEDVLMDCADVDLLPLQPSKRFELRRSLHWKFLHKDVSRRLAFMNPGLQPLSVTGNYDLFVFVCPIYSDPLYVNSIRGWKDRCKTSVCWIDELWANQVPKFRYWLPFLREFDHVILGLRGSVEAVSASLGRRCHYVAGAVDALRFSPYPDPPNRVIDIYSIGRRSEEIHRTLLKLARNRNLFYVHDSLQNVGNSQTVDHQEHRSLYANLAKRSRLFVVAPALANNPGLTGGQVEVGYRYYEATAAGAVLVGQSPDCESFGKEFDWPDVVIQTKSDGSDVAKVVASFMEDPGRAQEISRRNALNALLRHDWVYRWEQILSIAGLPPTAGMQVRKSRLRELAILAGSSRLAEEGRIHLNSPLRKQVLPGSRDLGR